MKSLKNTYQPRTCYKQILFQKYLIAIFPNIYRAIHVATYKIYSLPLKARIPDLTFNKLNKSHLTKQGFPI